MAEIYIFLLGVGYLELDKKSSFHSERCVVINTTSGVLIDEMILLISDLIYASKSIKHHLQRIRCLTWC